MRGGGRKAGSLHVVCVAMAVALVSFIWDILIFPQYNMRNNYPKKDNGKSMSFGVKRSTADILMPSTTETGEPGEPGFVTEAVFANHSEQCTGLGLWLK